MNPFDPAIQVGSVRRGGIGQMSVDEADIGRRVGVDRAVDRRHVRVGLRVDMRSGVAEARVRLVTSDQERDQEQPSHAGGGLIYRDSKRIDARLALARVSVLLASDLMPMPLIAGTVLVPNAFW